MAVAFGSSLRLELPPPTSGKPRAGREVLSAPGGEVFTGEVEPGPGNLAIGYQACFWNLAGCWGDSGTFLGKLEAWA